MTLCIIWYFGDILCWYRSHLPVEKDGLALTFNSMMQHLLHGQFDVDPDTVGKEGFLHNGHVYAYWGVLPAFFRLPLMLLHNGLHIDLTRLSCAIAAIIMFLINCKTLDYISNKFSSDTPWLKNLLLVAISLSGMQICFLCSSLYQEVCLWALVFGMLFVHWALRTCLNEEDTPKALIWMSIASVLALLTRVSMGIGLYAAEGLLILVILWRCRSAHLLSRRWLQYSALAILILIAGLAITAEINIQRWGNPLTFANYNLYLYNADFPDRMIRTQQYGLFNIQRIPLGLIYFFFPLWAFQDSSGHFFFQNAFTRLIDTAELPPSSFFLTDGIFLLLGGIFLLSFNKPKLQTINFKMSALAIMAGLTIPALLMLMAISMNFRYRAEFYPLIMFMGFMGALSASRISNKNKWFKPTCISLVVIGVIASHFTLLLYDVSALGPATRFMKNGVVAYYLNHLGL